jgi:cation:H+ antiporter
MGVDIIIILLSLALILACCAVFVNAVEYLGDKLNLHQGIVGSILAAVGTAMPETVIPIIAILFTGGEKSAEVGVGAILGAPFMLSTLAFFVTGTAVIVYAIMGKRTFKMTVDPKIMSKDLSFFLIMYSLAVVASLVHSVFALKLLIAVALLGGYGLYLKKIISADADMVENVGHLYLSKYVRLPDTLAVIIFQICLALGFIIVGAHYFIIHIQNVSLAVGVSPLILSLIITPIATELPEKFNSVIWIGRRKDTLALGNMTGAMVFQSCFPVIFGILFTDWKLEGITLVTVGLALTSSIVSLIFLRVKQTLSPFVLLLGGVLYAVFFVAIAMGIR